MVGNNLVNSCLPSASLVDSSAAWWVQFVHTNVEIETQTGVGLLCKFVIGQFQS